MASTRVSFTSLVTSPPLYVLWGYVCVFGCVSCVVALSHSQQLDDLSSIPRGDGDAGAQGGRGGEGGGKGPSTLIHQIHPVSQCCLVIGNNDILQKFHKDQ